VGASQGRVAAPGEYWSAVNVHNPSARPVVFRVKVAVALPEHPGPVSPFRPFKLGADQALEIDREYILEVGGGAFVKGFVVLESPIELDVVTVHTAAGAEGAVETLETERVPARRIQGGLPDLVPRPDEQGSFCRRD